MGHFGAPSFPMYFRRGNRTLSESEVIGEMLTPDPMNDDFVKPYNSPVPYQHQEYPKFMYHYASEPKLIKSQAEEMALGQEWKPKPYPEGYKPPKPKTK